MRPDVLVLNEFVDGPTRQALKSDLAQLGLPHVRSSARVGRHNQVLVASRFEIETGRASGDFLDPMAQSNFLAVRVCGPGLEIVGLRTPAYKHAAERKAYWGALDQIVRANPAALFIGDLNADPAYPRSAGGAALVSLAQSGWTVPKAEGDWSYCSLRARTRIDHAIVPRNVDVKAARYVAGQGDVVFAGSEKHLYDHAPLVLDLDLAS